MLGGPSPLSERLVQALRGLIDVFFKDDTLYVLLNMILVQAKHDTSSETQGADSGGEGKSKQAEKYGTKEK